MGISESEKRREYYLKNHIKIRAAQRKYRLTHSEKIKKQKRNAYYKDKPKHYARARRYQRKLKQEVFLRYSPNLECVYCGVKGIEFLTIDHVNGRVPRDRFLKTHKGGGKLYGWLKKNNYPKDFQLLCWNCNSVKGLFGLTRLKELLSKSSLNKPITMIDL